MLTIFKNTCPKAHVYVEVKENLFVDHHSTTQRTVYIQIEIFFNGLVKGFTNMLKSKVVTYSQVQ